MGLSRAHRTVNAHGRIDVTGELAPDRAKVAIVSADPDLIELLTCGLREGGFDPFSISDVHALRSADDPGASHLVILDSDLDDSNGFETLKQLREATMAPVIVLVPPGDGHLLASLLGPGDYVTKPFGFQELLAVVRMVLRRSQRDWPSNAPGAAPPLLAA